MDKPFRVSYIDKGISRISEKHAKYMWRMKNPIWNFLMLNKDYYKRKFADYMQFNSTIKFDKNFICNTEHLKVGDYSSLANLYIHDNGPVTIGKHVSFAKNVSIICGTHDLVDFNKCNCYSVVVEDYAFLALGSMILYNVTIGRGAYVGTGSVVRNDVPPYAIVFGNPAKVIGFRMTPDEIVEYEKKVYQEHERLPLDLLKHNFKKYFISRYKEIRDYSKI